MINLTSSCTVQARTVTGADPDTGAAVRSLTTIMVNQPCAFSILSATDHAQSWGDDVTPTRTDVVTGSLVLPSWAPPMTGEDRYTVTVKPWPGTWHVRAVRPGREWSTYLLQAS